MLDERTLFFVLALIPGLLALVCGSLRTGLGEDARGLGHQALSLALLAIASAVVSIFGQVWSVAFGLACWFASMAIMTMAVRHFASAGSRSWLWLAAAAPVFLVAITLQGSPRADVWRILLVSALFIACAAGGIRALARLPAPARPRGTPLIALGFALGILVSLFRAIAMPILDVQSAFLMDGTSIASIFLLGMLICLTLVSLGLIMGAADRVRVRLGRLASTDALTGVLNRRGFQERAPDLLALPAGESEAHALALLDLDDFKRLNDRLGHATGDEALVQLARLIGGQARANDVVARLGGEEFVVLLPATGAGGAKAWAEQLRAVIEAELRAADGIAVTASIGVAAVPAGTPLESLYRLADAALYHAKDSGKNRVVLA